jgi:hypothetical protein
MAFSGCVLIVMVCMVDPQFEHCSYGEIAGMNLSTKAVPMHRRNVTLEVLITRTLHSFRHFVSNICDI